MIARDRRHRRDRKIKNRTIGFITDLPKLHDFFPWESGGNHQAQARVPVPQNPWDLRSQRGPSKATGSSVIGSSVHLKRTRKIFPEPPKPGWLFISDLLGVWWEPPGTGKSACATEPLGPSLAARALQGHRFIGSSKENQKNIPRATQTRVAFLFRTSLESGGNHQAQARVPVPQNPWDLRSQNHQAQARVPVPQNPWDLRSQRGPSKATGSSVHRFI